MRFLVAVQAPFELSRSVLSVTLLTVILLSGQCGSRDLGCTTTVGGPDAGKPCALPFTFRSVTYLGCTKDRDPDGWYWCSTLTDENNNHIPRIGRWGYCNASCNYDAVWWPPDVEDDDDDGEGKDDEASSEQEDSETRPDGNEPPAKLDVFDVTDDVTEGPANVPISVHLHHLRPGFWWPSQATGTVMTAKHEAEWDSITDSGRSTKAPRDRPRNPMNVAPGVTFETGRNASRNLPVPAGDADDLDATSRGTWLPTPSSGSCGYKANVGYIVGGENVREGEFPFVVALGYSENGGMVYSCAGSLINKRYVLTAAHCHDQRKDNLMVRRVVIGVSNLAHPEEGQNFDIEPKDVTLHEDWDPDDVTAGNDIALIRLPRPASMSTEDPSVMVLPACLYWEYDPLHVTNFRRWTFEALGWGRTTNVIYDGGDLRKTGAFSSSLKAVTVPFVPFRRCRSLHFHRFDVWPGRHICAGGQRGRDSCGGDSGGPLIAREDVDSPALLVGIVSFGTTKCGLGMPGIYTNVHYYIPWIKKNLRL